MILALLLAGCGPDGAPDSGGADTDVADDAAADSASDTSGWGAPGAACALASDLADPYLLEGESVAFTVSCTGELATADADIVAVGLPAGATYDATTRAFAWTTGPADGGRIDVVFSVTPRDGSAEVPTAETITFWVADDPSDAANVAVDPATYTEEWGLPVFHIDVAAAIGEEYTDASIVYGGHTYAATIKVRGASSSYYPKPSYMMEFDDEELPVDAWGVHRDHLILLSTFDDNSYVRQKLVYDLWAAMAEYWGVARLTPRSFFAVVYLGGRYAGLYVGLDRIDDEFLGQMGFDRDANLYKAVDHNANFALTNVYGSAKSTLHDGYTKAEGLPEDDFDDLDDLVSFTGSVDAETLVAEAPDWFDVREFMDWFLLVHYTTSEDSAGKNAYLYNVPGDWGFRYVPWDFNHSLGQGWYTYRIPADYSNDFSGDNRIFWAIQSVPSADAEQWARYAAMRADGPLNPAWLRAQVDAYYALIEPSAQRDWRTWAESYRSYGGWAASRDQSGDWTDYDAEKAYLYQWLEDRAAYMDAMHP